MPLKNLRPLCGQPLIWHTLTQATAAGVFDFIVVSTDSPEIADAARAAGAEVPFVRPPHLATDVAPKLPVIRHALLASEECFGRGFEAVVDLDVTAPLRLPDDIVASLRLLEEGEAPNVFSVTRSRHSPYFNMVEERDSRVQLVKELPGRVVRRQDAPVTYDMNASIYVWRRDVLLREDSLFLPGTAIYFMPPERSIDIDSEFDWALVEFLMGRRGTAA